MRFTLREACLKDADQMAALDKECFSLPWSRRAFIQELKDNALSFYIVYEIEGEIIGYAGLWKVVEEGHITNIAVHPEHRKKGVGEKLLSELIYRTMNSGISKFTLEVRVSNEDAINLYKKLGFKPAGIRKEYYSDNLEDALILWLD